MINQIKRFEIIILRPLIIMFLVFAIAFFFKGMWWWLVGCVVSVFYLGIIGSKLHHLQSALDLAQGPIKSPAACTESDLLPLAVKQMLVGHACTKVGILVGFAAGAISWAALGWQWYFALLSAWFAMVLSGALLKLTFRTIEYRN